MTTAGGIGGGGGITERAAGTTDGGMLVVAAMAGSLHFWEPTMYHQFVNLESGNQGQATATTPRWDFLTNHAHVLLCMAHDPGIRLRDIAVAVGITERAAHRIVSELVEGGYVLRERNGRRNRYEVVAELPLRHPLVGEQKVGDLLKLLGSRGE